MLLQVKETVDITTGAVREFGVTVVMLGVLLALLVIIMYLFARYIVLPMRDRHFVFLDATAATNQKNAETNGKLVEAQLGQGPKLETVHMSLVDLHRKVDSVAKHLRQGRDEEG